MPVFLLASSTVQFQRGQVVNRRALLTRLVATGVLGLGVGEGQAHTPYSQWKVYRQRHLLIGASREDAPTYPLAKSITAVLNENLPAARATVDSVRPGHKCHETIDPFDSLPTASLS